MRVLEWNIHGAQGYGNYCIPEFVADEIMQKEGLPDIIVLTEFVMGCGWDYLRGVLSKRYSLFCSPYVSKQNGVLIALRNDVFNLDSAVVTTGLNTSETEKPNFLQVTLKHNDIPFTVIGTRIRVARDQELNIKLKKNQFKALDDHLSSMREEHVICIGDFNVYWSNKDGSIWNKKENYTLPKTSESFELHTPKWNYEKNHFSYVLENNSLVSFDHVITRGIKITPASMQYDWSFINKENGYYKSCNDKVLTPSDYKSDLIGLPDHAILVADFNLS